ncbi:MAG: hypothetical protein U0176_07875 [Bacteroidia bacterium]
MTRIYLPIGGFLLGMGVAAAGIFVTWIPEWYGFKATLCAVGLIGAAVAGVLIVRGTWLATKERMENAFRVVITVLPGLLMLGLVGFGALLSAFVLGGGFFEPTFNRKVEFSDPKATVYFYDSGFLDTETTVFLRNGALPIMREVARVRYYLDGTGTTTQSGDWVDFSGFQINLATGEAKDDLP